MEERVTVKGMVKKHQKHTIRGKLIHFFGWWLGFMGLYSSSAQCPFCGQIGCPVGFASAGIFGAFFSTFVLYFNALYLYFKKIFFNFKKSRG